MQMNGTRQIRATRARVWEHLNDPAVLRACIPGCQSLEGSPEEGFTAQARLAVGPIKATFAGEVTLSDVAPPESYRIAGQGKGGIAGYASGGANVRLTENADGTLLSYEVEAAVGGKLAQLGARLIDSTATKLSGQFFDSFVAICEDQTETAG